MRVAAVSGGAGAIGGAIVRVLEARGLTVATLDLAPAAGERQWTVDIRDRSAVDAAVADVGRTLGAVAVLVNAAGIAPPHAAVADLRTDELEAVLAVNLTGAVHLSQAVLPAMLDAGWGRIVNVTSIQARGGWRDRAAYATSKAALRTFTESLAVEVAGRGVLVNAVAPGHVRTPMTAAPGVAIDWTALIARNPLGRLVTAEEIAHAVAFLVGDEASGIAGETITVDGGYSADLVA
jgi:NAD(P)-dependent dehydrogenase (short-subunit alcohol dehydrogenase family)